ncbi:Bro-N domain-containing protein [Sodalis endosymbiont of Spalangia cameroni]|uniref:BRO-N domain-containing protein n=1 Tax=Sodalis praecaptivus TaxID=1239307 RepID=UPI0031F7E70B
MTTTLVFRNTVLETISLDGQLWLTSAELAKALEYSISKSVTDLFNKNADEFSPSMSKVVESTTLGKSRNKTRIFSLRGAHLIAMLSRTPVAKEFRTWVLDILDKEIDIPQYKPQAAELFNNNDIDRLTRMVWEMSNGFHFDRAWSNAIWHTLRRVTGVPSPQHFEIRQLPLLAEECNRIYSITNQLKEAIFDAEKQTMRRILRHREDEAIVLGEMQRMLEESTQEHYSVMTNALEKWQQANVSQFLQRH